MWWKAGPQDLFRIEDRISTIYVERCHIDRDDNAIVFINKEKIVHLPVALVATLMIGPGTRVTHAAMALLGDSGTAVCWVGEKGVRFYAHGSGPYTGNQLLMKQVSLVSNQKSRLNIARKMYSQRFPDEDVKSLNMQQLRGREGYRVKNIYKVLSKETGVPWNGRIYKHGSEVEVGDKINRVLSIAHSCLYGMCYAAIVGIGLSPAIGFVHTGNAISFVLDVADLYKAETTIPLAFNLVAKGIDDERSIRIGFRNQVTERKLMPTVVNNIKSLLTTEVDFEEDDLNELWDDSIGHVSGGKDWSNDALVRSDFDYIEIMESDPTIDS